MSFNNLLTRVVSSWVKLVREIEDNFSTSL